MFREKPRNPYIRDKTRHYFKSLERNNKLMKERQVDVNHYIYMYNYNYSYRLCYFLLLLLFLYSK